MSTQESRRVAMTPATATRSGATTAPRPTTAPGPTAPASTAAAYLSSSPVLTTLPADPSADGSAAPSHLTSPSRPARRRLTAPLLLGLVVLGVWEVVSRSGAVPAFFLPPPSAVAVRLAEDLSAGGLLGYVAPTLLEAALGCLLGAAVALPLGYLIFRSARAAAAVEPYVAASQAVPAVALAPLLMLWLGYGLLPIVVLCALTVFFPIVLATVLGLRTIDHDVVDAARLDGAGEWHLLRHIELPLALPALLTGLRNGFTLSVTGAVVGEFVMGGQGLGMLVAARGDSADTVGIFAALVVLCGLAMSVYGLLGALERRLDH